ncbi:hypothetical protein AM493_16565 [Flavobacterium akiainvivens]|uniref:Uncharacterized protein n=1 Tax=Flavobacterium akiainvivens TaxID=1202724 RepID=A0A0M8MKM1_9FLAO|nr:DUF6252 family protein [Flavobacterium akiainvivens]KOS07478.1 hypothetical protein AM493_16565 [Flavobacterium akiainvivens]SFQ63409.1 hypothetical protein SAMN05444144_11140 [Flavobacterium akiainvivens]
MKKFLYLLVLLAGLTSCEEDIQFNTPAVQALKNNELWRATQFSAVKGSDNSLTLNATNGFETLVLKTANTAPGTYALGVNETDKASYVLVIESETETYQTGAGVGQGTITISDNPEETNVDAGFITGTFRFAAVGDNSEQVYFQEGVFYKVPIAPAQ